LSDKRERQAGVGRSRAADPRVVPLVVDEIVDDVDRGDRALDRGGRLRNGTTNAPAERVGGLEHVGRPAVAARGSQCKARLSQESAQDIAELVYAREAVQRAR